VEHARDCPNAHAATVSTVAHCIRLFGVWHCSEGTGHTIHHHPNSVAKETSQDHPFWKPVVEFATHVLTASMIFVIVAIPALLIEAAVHGLERIHVTGLIIQGLNVAEYAIFGGDILLLVLFLIKSGYRAIKEL
jgi:hypothetical protein